MDSALLASTTSKSQLDEQGFVRLPGNFSKAEATELANNLIEHLRRYGEDVSIRGGDGTIYAARNLLRHWPAAAEFWRRSMLLDSLSAVLGPGFGLVRMLYFDKPPGQTWALPWHKDLTVAVRDNRLPSSHFSKPTRKAGVPHAEAPLDVLESMLTARLHLDSVDAGNGPLKVIPGSHRTGKALTLDLAPPQTLYAEAGDVLLIRPLIAHCSGKSSATTSSHRRILHLEFAARRELPDGYRWDAFIDGGGKQAGDGLIVARKGDTINRPG